ncbi:hypothetical protein Nmel_008497 [Mimus melanotis]
MRLFQTYVIL